MIVGAMHHGFNMFSWSITSIASEGNINIVIMSFDGK